MKVIRLKDQIAEVAKRWREQYATEVVLGTGPRADIYNSLLTLDPETATRADVAAIIGNDSWIGVNCSECGERVEETVMVGEEPDYESATVFLCFSCARAVADAIAHIARQS